MNKSAVTKKEVYNTVVKLSQGDNLITQSMVYRAMGYHSIQSSGNKICKLFKELIKEGLIIQKGKLYTLRNNTTKDSVKNNSTKNNFKNNSQNDNTYKVHENVTEEKLYKRIKDMYLQLGHFPAKGKVFESFGYNKSQNETCYIYKLFESLITKNKIKRISSQLYDLVDEDDLKQVKKLNKPNELNESNNKDNIIKNTSHEEITKEKMYNRIIEIYLQTGKFPSKSKIFESFGYNKNQNSTCYIYKLFDELIADNKIKKISSKQYKLANENDLKLINKSENNEIKMENNIDNQNIQNEIKETNNIENNAENNIIMENDINNSIENIHNTFIDINNLISQIDGSYDAIKLKLIKNEQQIEILTKSNEILKKALNNAKAEAIELKNRIYGMTFK